MRLPDLEHFLASAPEPDSFPFVRDALTHYADALQNPQFSDINHNGIADDHVTAYVLDHLKAKYGPLLPPGSTSSDFTLRRLLHPIYHMLVLSKTIFPQTYVHPRDPSLGGVFHKVNDLLLQHIRRDPITFATLYPDELRVLEAVYRSPHEPMYVSRTMPQ